MSLKQRKVEASASTSTSVTKEAENSEAEIKVHVAGWEKFYLKYVGPFVDFTGQNIPPGPKCIPQYIPINLQKGGTLFFVLGLMKYYNRWDNPTAWVYLGMHGSYGIAWLLKHMIFRDPNWDRKVTIPSAIMSWVAVLGPYWIAPYLIISRNLEVSAPRLAACVFTYALGVCAMMASDCQKYYTLKYKKGLISDGWFYRTRNPNYLAEMMIYGAFAGACPHPAPWAVLAWVWSNLFMLNMVRKEMSLRKKDGWEEYSKRSYMLLPKLF